MDLKDIPMNAVMWKTPRRCRPQTKAGMIQMSKRQFRTPKRSSQKVLIIARKGAVGTSQVSTSIVGVTSLTKTWVGGTIVGGVVKGGAAAGGRVSMALVHVKEGVPINTLSTTDGAKLLTPEENVLWMRPFQFSAGADAIQKYEINDKLKAKRIMREGSSLVLVALASIADTADYHLAVTGFLLL